MSENKVSVAAIVLNYRRADDTIACVRSLLRSEGLRPDIVVVDNCSGDGSAGRITAALPGITLVSTDENLGYAGGNNVGIRAALAGNAGFLFIVNNDCLVAPDALTIMRDAARAGGAGMVSPKIYDLSRPDVIQCAGYRNIHILAQGIPRGEGEKDMGQYDREMEVNAAPGCALFMSRELLERVGLFDEKFFAYSEELDLCRRVVRAGYRILFVPKARVWHRKAATLDMESADYLYYLTRGRLIYARKHLGWFPFLSVFIPYFLVVKFLKPLVICAVRGRWRHVAALFMAVFRNLKDRIR